MVWCVCVCVGGGGGQFYTFRAFSIVADRKQMRYRQVSREWGFFGQGAEREYVWGVANLSNILVFLIFFSGKT